MLKWIGVLFAGVFSWVLTGFGLKDQGDLVVFEGFGCCLMGLCASNIYRLSLCILYRHNAAMYC